LSTKREAYLCLSAMLRAREPKLLNNDRAARMLDAASFDEAAKLLTDCGYNDMSQMSAREIESYLALRRDGIFAELEKLAPDAEVVDVFRMKYDYHNAKVLIKAEAMGQDGKRLMSASGRIDPDRLSEIYNDDSLTQLPPVYGAAIAEAKNALARTANPQLADFILDRAYFEEMAASAKKLECGFLSGYAAILADSANLKSAVRTLRMGKGLDFMETALIPGGNVSKDRILAAGDKESITALFAHTLLEKAAALGAEAVSGGSMTEFELACDNAVNSYLGGAKLVSYGPEALIAYLAAVESETTAVRMILTGRLAGIAPDVIRERLRDMYA
jgi:V/A-type H+/Na+-transporting ATPase subunit C